MLTLAAAVCMVGCVSPSSTKVPSHAEKVWFLDHVVDTRGERVPDARVRAFHGVPTATPERSQLLAEVRASYMGEFYIEADAKLFDFLLVDHQGACAILTRAALERSYKIVLRRPCNHTVPSNQTMQPTAGRRTVSIYFMKTSLVLFTRALASRG
jgi:hypothetical protein